MGAVTLNVADLDAMTRYYRDAVGLQVLTADGPVVTLGRGERPVVVLEHSPALRHAAPHEAGLYHTAILFNSQADLAAAVYSVAQARPGSFTGSSDHLVSQAFYFDDPEGNGVELYWDRGRDEWRHAADGTVVMDALRLDPNAFLGEHLTDASLETPASGDAVVGHVHLQVGDVPTARAFYVDTLGFDVTASWHGALFVSAGGYHHHLAMNTWNSAGAGPRASSLGLGEVRIALPTADDLGALGARLAHAGVPVADDGVTLRFEDPWRNVVQVAVPA
jgi:catechol 2,3-dioxygenase